MHIVNWTFERCGPWMCFVFTSAMLTVWRVCKTQIYYKNFCYRFAAYIFLLCFCVHIFTGLSLVMKGKQTSQQASSGKWNIVAFIYLKREHVEYKHKCFHVRLLYLIKGTCQLFAVFKNCPTVFKDVSKALCIALT